MANFWSDDSQDPSLLLKVSAQTPCLARDRYRTRSTKKKIDRMPYPTRILVTGAGGRVGGIGRSVVELLRDRDLPVRAMVHREDERAAGLRATGAEVVAGDLLEPVDVYRVVKGCRRVYFGMS